MKSNIIIITKSGKKFPGTHPTRGVIDITDIAHSLSQICRWGGQREFISVAQHSVLVYELVKEVDPLNKNLHRHALLHDAAEAYIGDVLSWIKPMCPAYQELEAKYEKAVAEAFKLMPLSLNESKLLKQMDIHSREIELEGFLFKPPMAKKLFLTTFKELFNDKKDNS